MSAFDSFRTLFGSRRILWFNLSGAYVTGLDRLAPVEAVACLDDGLDFDRITRRSGVLFLSKERNTGRRTPLSDPAIDDIMSFLREEIETALASPPVDSWIWVAPRRCASLEAFGRQNGVRTASPPADLCHWLNHKANFFSGLDAVGLPRLPGEWMSLAGGRFSELEARFGGSFVVQAPRGVQGSGTAIIHSAVDFHAALSRLGADGNSWVAPYAGGLSLNINAFVMERRTAVSYPSVQLVGLPMLNVRPGGYCGNDFTASAMLPPGVVNDACEQAERLGGWLSSLGYRGIFGLDLVYEAEAGRLHAVDLNPRWQGSTLLETQAMLRKGRIPLAAAELAYQCGALSETEVVPLLDEFRQPVEGSQLLLHAAGPESVEVAEPLQPGIYRLAPALEYLKPAIELGEVAENGQMLIASSLPRPGTVIEPHSRPARIFALQPVLDPRSLQPFDWAARAVTEVHRALGLPFPAQPHP